ncbi:MAG: hypothetical protein LBC90_05290, partial [Candidatus Adiutrix sp.]|nr:hypothetical protein [Candidatus Adiutrix sp.]
MSESLQVQGEAGRNFESDSAGAAGIRRADFAACRELAREIGRLLNGFVPPAEGYRPEPAPPVRFGPEAGRDLGASCLADYFALALGGEARAEAGCLPVYFPRGPETFRQALAAVELEISRLVQAGSNLENNWPAGRSGLEAALRPLEERREALAWGLTGLRRASRLWFRLREESDLWLNEARAMWRNARRLEESQTLMFKSGPGDEPGWADPPKADLTGAVLKLRTGVEAARALVLESELWAEEAESLSAELEDLLALAAAGSEPDRDWAAIGRQLAGRLTELVRSERDLVSAAPGAAETLELAARTLAEAEKNLAGARGRETGGRLESLGRGVAALWRSVVDRRREMARLYFFLPERLGRPLYLERNFLSAARVLGRTQALLEDLRHRLSLAGGRLSSSQKLKSESDELLERLRHPRDRSEIIKTARRRLRSLARAASGPAAAPREGQDSLARALSSSRWERERLGERAAEATRALRELGLAKARLVRIFNRKTELLKAADQERLRLAEENQHLRAQRGELARRREALSQALVQVRERFQGLREALQKNQGDDLRAVLAEQEDTAARLEELRREKDQIEADRREVRTLLRQKAARAAEAEAGIEALTAELNRYKEELAEVSRARQALAETASVLRRRLDLLVQAHRSLKASLAKRNRRLVRAEAERDSLDRALTRQKRNLLRLAAARQELRAELGSARLKLADLEKERAAILTRLEEAKQGARDADSQKKVLEDRLGGLELEKEGLAGRLAELETGVSGSLLPFISVLGEALWRGEARFRRTREDHELTLTRMRLESEVREANLRLAGAARELEVTESVQAEKEQWAQALAQKEENLDRAMVAAQSEREHWEQYREKGQAEVIGAERARWEETLAAAVRAEGERWARTLQAERGQWVQALGQRDSQLARLRGQLPPSGGALVLPPGSDQEPGDPVVRLSRRSEKLGQVIGLMKRRYDRRLAEAGQTESALRGDLERQAREMAESFRRLAELEPLLDYFFQSAEQSLPPGDANLELARYLREENRGLRLPDGGRDSIDRVSAALKAKLAEFQPLVTFLARSFVAGVAELAQARRERELLEGSLAEREALLIDRTGEVSALKDELARADRDLAENDGRLEAAWAAMNYLGAKAGDRLGEIRSRLENQTRQVDSLTLELGRRETRIRELEERQDQLSLLYWTLVAQAGAGTAASSPDSPPDLAPADSAPPDLVQAQGGGFSLGRQIL